MKKITKPAAAVATAACLTVLGLTACSQAAAPVIPDTITVESAKKNSVTVQATEEVKVVPDMAEIKFSVTSQSEDAKTCQQQNSADLNQVINFLKEFGIPDTSIQTSSYGLNPIYDWNAGQTITGYEMETTVTISDVPIDQTGGLLSSCVEKGINSISSVSYLSSQYDNSYQEALKKAIETAKVKAETIAQASGQTVGGVIHVEEYNNSQEARYILNKSAGAVKEEMDAAMPVEPGQISVEAQVSVEFSIQ